jgi:recombinational DNA repair protein RecR
MPVEKIHTFNGPETTAAYLSRLINLGIRVNRLALGLPVGRREL